MDLSHPQLKILGEVVFATCAALYETPARGRLVVLYGPNGCGKTHAVRQIERWFNRVRLKLPIFCRKLVEPDETPNDVANCLRVNWAEVIDGIKQDQWRVFELLGVECLAIIDDIGAEHDPSGIGREKLYSILNRREFMWTVVTTNISPNEWPKRFENRIASRLFRNSVHVDLTGVKDYSA